MSASNKRKFALVEDGSEDEKTPRATSTRPNVAKDEPDIIVSFSQTTGQDRIYHLPATLSIKTILDFWCAQLSTSAEEWLFTCEPQHQAVHHDDGRVLLKDLAVEGKVLISVTKPSTLRITISEAGRDDTLIAVRENQDLLTVLLDLYGRRNDSIIFLYYLSREFGFEPASLTYKCVKHGHRLYKNQIVHVLCASGNSRSAANNV